MVIPAHKAATEVNVEALMEIERVSYHDVTTALGRSLRVARLG